MIDRKECLKSVTPVGTAVFPKLNKPDFKYKEHGEYVVKVRFPAEDVVALIAEIDAFHAKAYALESRPGKVPSPKKIRESNGRYEEGDPFFGTDSFPYHDALDKEGNVIEGLVEMKFSTLAGGTREEKNPDTGEMETKTWTRGVIVVDASSPPKPTKAQVGGGSKVKVSFSTYVWCNASIGFGVSFRIEGVQVVELVTFGAKSADELGFGEIEGGFVADDESPPDEPDGSDAETSPDTDKQPEF